MGRKLQSSEESHQGSRNTRYVGVISKLSNLVKQDGTKVSISSDANPGFTTVHFRIKSNGSNDMLSVIRDEKKKVFYITIKDNEGGEKSIGVYDAYTWNVWNNLINEVTGKEFTVDNSTNLQGDYDSKEFLDLLPSFSQVLSFYGKIEFMSKLSNSIEENKVSIFTNPFGKQGNLNIRLDSSNEVTGERTTLKIVRYGSSNRKIKVCFGDEGEYITYTGEEGGFDLWDSFIDKVTRTVQNGEKRSIPTIEAKKLLGLLNSFERAISTDSVIMTTPQPHSSTIEESSSTTKAPPITTETVKTETYMLDDVTEAGLMEVLKKGVIDFSEYVKSKLPGSSTIEESSSTTEALPPSTGTLTTEYVLNEAAETKSREDIRRFGEDIESKLHAMRNGTNNGTQSTNGTLGFVPELGSINTTSGNITQFNQPGTTGGVSPAAAWVAFGVMGAMTAGVVGIVGLVAAARWVTTQIMGERYTVVQDEEKQPSTSVEQPFLEPVVRTQKTVNA